MNAPAVKFQYRSGSTIATPLPPPVSTNTEAAWRSHAYHRVSRFFENTLENALKIL
jgi:hypothetical protein